MAAATSPRIRRGRGAWYARVPWALQDGKCRHAGACQHDAVDASTIAVYAALQRYADFGGVEGARVSDKTAAKAACVSRATFMRRREQLRAMGWVEWEGGQVSGKPLCYLVHLSLVDDAEGGVAVGDTSGVAVGNTPLSPPATPPVAASDSPTIDRESLTEKTNHRAPAAPAVPASRVTWLTPYIDVHEKALPGSVPPAGPMAVVFKQLEAAVLKAHPQASVDSRQRTIAHHQHRYLEHLKAEGKIEFLSYPRFAETFSEWAKPRRNGTSRRADTSGTGNLRDGMDELK